MTWILAAVPLCRQTARGRCRPRYGDTGWYCDMVWEVGELGNRVAGLWGFLEGEGCQRCQESTVESVPGEHSVGAMRAQCRCYESTVWVL